MRCAKIILLTLLACAALVPLSAQSRLPSNANNWLQSASTTGNGDIDRVNVIFFEVPDTTTSTLYFAVNDPGVDGAAPDQGIGTTSFYLVGGSGALSDPNSRLRDYSADQSLARTGVVLSSYTADDSGPYNNGWYYFPQGVSPSQGEHIGNRYFFKIVAECGTEAGIKSAYQVDISYSGINPTWPTAAAAPTGVSGVRSFAYSWMVDFRSTQTWNIYPFVPENANATASGNTDYVVFMNFDMDSQESSAASSRTGKALTAPAISGNDVEAGTAYNLYDTNQAAPGVTDERNGTWTLTVTEVGAEGIAENSTELWFTLDPNNTVPLGDGELLRAYASAITGPASPDHVTLTYQDGSALANNLDTETIYLQVVDSSGNPLNYSRDIYVTITDAGANPATISAISAGTNNSSNALITTDAWGFGYLRVIRNNNGAAPTDEALPVTITAYWNGTGGSDSFGTNTSGTIGVTFYEDPAPTLSSASNLSFTEGSTASLPTITIADSGVNNFSTTSEIRIRIPGTLSANFNQTLTTPTFGGGNAANINTTVSYPTSKILLIDVTNSFAVGSTLTIAGLAFTATNSDSSGRLEMSFDGGATWSVIDDKTITIQDTGGTSSYTWTGATSIVWATGTNWLGGTSPGAGAATYNITITALGSMPTLAAALTANNLTIEAGATLTTGNNNLTVANLVCYGTLNASAQTNPRRVTVSGDLRGTGTISAGSGAPAVTAATSTALDLNITTTGGGDLTFSGAVVLSGSSTLSTDAATDGNITFNSTIDGAGNLTLTAGTGIVTLSGAVGGTGAVSSLSVQTAGAFALPAVTTTGALSVTCHRGHHPERGAGDRRHYHPGGRGGQQHHPEQRGQQLHRHRGGDHGQQRGPDRRQRHRSWGPPRSAAPWGSPPPGPSPRAGRWRSPGSPP